MNPFIVLANDAGQPDLALNVNLIQTCKRQENGCYVITYQGLNVQVPEIVGKKIMDLLKQPFGSSAGRLVTTPGGLVRPS